MTGLNSKLFVSLVGALGLVFWFSVSDAKTSNVKKSTRTSVAAGPVCDLMAHPKITKVTPDTVKPGQRITIKGSKFGTKECFQNVSFGPVGTKDFKYVNESTVEVTVPTLKPGMVPVNILTAGGSSQFMVLVQK